MTLTTPTTSTLLPRFLDVRALADRLAAPLSAEDQVTLEVRVSHVLDTDGLTVTTTARDASTVAALSVALGRLPGLLA